MNNISFFLPAYNEADNLSKQVAIVYRYLKKRFKKYEIIIINDGSNDNTGDIAQNLSKKYKNIKIITHKKNKGYGAALVSGFKYSRYEMVAFTDADLQYDINDLTNMIEKIKDYDCIIGYRKQRETLFRKFNARAWSILIYFLFKYNFKDIDCAFKLFKKKIINNIQIESFGAMASAELLIKISDKKIKILEIPVRHRPRQAGNASGGNPKVILRAFYELLKFSLRRINSS